MRENLSFQELISKVKKHIDVEMLLKKKPGKEEITTYYIKNKLAYLWFHNRQGFMHMGLSSGRTYKFEDLLEPLKIIESNFQNNTKNVLELGCGNGTNSMYLAKKYPKINFYGIDLSVKKPFSILRHRNYSQSKGDFQELKDYPQKKFDLIFIIEALCHAEVKRKVLQNIEKKLKPGGKCIIFDGYRSKAYSDMSKNERLGMRITSKAMAVDSFIEIQQFRNEIKKAKLKIISEQNLSHKIIPSLERFYKTAEQYTQDRMIFKIARMCLPKIVIQNGAAGLLLPKLIQSKTASYYLHILEKP